MNRIVHLGKFYPPDMGGTEIITQSVAKAASEVGYDVVVVCFGQSGNGGDKDAGVSVLRYPVAKIVSSQPLSFGYFFAAVREARKADIVHLHAANFLSALSILFIGFRPKLLVHWHMDVIGKGVLGKIVVPLEWLMLKRADLIVATSQRYVERSIPLKPFLSKVRVVPLGITPAQIGCEKCALPERLADFIGTRRFVLSVGRLSAYKGFPFLIEAAKYLPGDVAVVIAGGGELARELAGLIDENGLQNKVLLAGRVSQEELTSLYQNADLFCLPSILRSEAFGVVLLEAMAYSLPIVATNIIGSGVSWVNEEGVSGLNVTPGNSKELADACIRILSDDDLRLKYSIGARKRYENNFTEERFRELSLAVYADILKNR
ncbi:glycosyltransferase [Azonexus hydrophilus]|uniref:glycosyltransferase n=1 Tax=Azonexus hydrophilus TaxID=418702 RepID=UPI0009DD79CF|nr:glycosyltransferase [Azonexus hydrophilus]